MYCEEVKSICDKIAITKRRVGLSLKFLKFVDAFARKPMRLLQCLVVVLSFNSAFGRLINKLICNAIVDITTDRRVMPNTLGNSTILSFDELVRIEFV